MRSDSRQIVSAAIHRSFDSDWTVRAVVDDGAEIFLFGLEVDQSGTGAIPRDPSFDLGSLIGLTVDEARARKSGEP